MRKVLFVILLSVSSLNMFAQKFTVQQGGHCFTMDIPAYMTKTYELNDVAPLQYQNTSKEAYVIVIDDSKDQLESLGIKFIDAKDFLLNFIKNYKKDANSRKTSSITEFQSNRNGHAQVELTWKDENIEYFMLITSVETPTHFYKIMCWTIMENKEILMDDYLAISKTLKD